MVTRRLVASISLMAVMTGFLVGVASSSQVEAQVSPTIVLPVLAGSQTGVRQTAVKFPDEVALGGSVDAGATQGKVQEAKVRILNSSGTEIRSVDLTSQTKVSGTEIVTLPDAVPPGTLTLTEGRLSGGNGGTLVFEVTVKFESGSVTGSTPSIPIDLQAPVIEAAELKSPTEIEVLFSENVQEPEGESPANWTVHDRRTNTQSTVSAVTCAHSSCPNHDRRTLTLGVAQDQDAAPRIDYVHIPTNPTAGEPYLDRAGHRLALAPDPEDDRQNCRCALAKDLIKPAIPSITSIDNENPQSSVGNDPTPPVTVASLRSGNVAEVYREETGGGWDPDDDPLIGAAIANPTGTAVVETCRDASDPNNAPLSLCDQIGPDNTYTLYAVARDPSGNRSGPGAASGSYKLDRVAPQHILAGTNGTTVDVYFTEEITGASTPAGWTINGTPPISVTGSGAKRTLQATGTVPEGADVAWSGSDGRDRADNPLGPFTTKTVNGLTPVVRITEPQGKQWTQAETFTIQGTTENQAHTVRIFRDDNPHNGVADDPNAPVATGSVSGDAFGVQVPLNAGPSVENNFVVQAVRSNPDLAGSYVDVPTIVQDSADPQVNVTAPGAGTPLRGGQTFTVRWSASDPGGSSSSSSSTAMSSSQSSAFVALGPGPISIDYSTDGGATWNDALDAQGQTADREANDGEFSWLVPDTSTSTARIRVTAIDEAERTGSAQSPDFTIDADNPFFNAMTKDTNQVMVRFVEPVRGFVTAPEWTIDGTAAKSISPAGQVNGVTEFTLTTFQPLGNSATPEITYSRLVSATQLVDGVGNEVSPTSTKAGDGIPPGAPTVTDPASPVFTGQDKQRIKGTAEEGTLVTIYRDEGNDGTADEEVGSQQLGPGETLYDIEVTLRDGVNELLVVASDQADNVSPGADVPTINADLEGPAVTIVQPTAGQVVGGGDDAFTVRWIATDTNLVHESISIEYSTDGGASFLKIAENEPNDGEFSFPIANDPVEAAMVRVTARDTYGRVGEATSGPFEILFCEVVGTDGNDVLVGTDRGETICPFDGEDTVHGRGGDDIVLAGNGAKKIDGGSGNDKIDGSPSNDLLRGGSGDDLLDGLDGNDNVLGDEGRDMTIGGNGDDSLRGGSGNDRLLGDAGNDRLSGDSGNDTLSGAEGNDSGRGGSGKDTLSGDAGNDQLRGDSGNDRLKGGVDNDRLVGGANNDRLDGMDGRDNLKGGSGNDRLAGGPGKDRCAPGSGANVVSRSC